MGHTASSITLPDQVEPIAEIAALGDAIREGLASGPAVPLDMDEVRRKAKRRLASGDTEAKVGP